jgi:isopenicillin N synthase-like dioxygenase
MAYYVAMEAMTTRLVPVVAMALDLPADYFSEPFRRAELHDPAHSLSATSEPGRQRVRLRAAYRQ